MWLIVESAKAIFARKSAEKTHAGLSDKDEVRACLFKSIIRVSIFKGKTLKLLNSRVDETTTVLYRKLFYFCTIGYTYF